MRPVQPLRRKEKKRDASCAVHSSAALMFATPAACSRSRANPGRWASQPGLPSERWRGTKRRYQVRRGPGQKPATHRRPPRTDALRCTAPAMPAHRAAPPPPLAAARPAWPPARPRTGHAIRHARRPRRCRRGRRTAPAGSRPPAPCKPHPWRRSRRRRQRASGRCLRGPATAAPACHAPGAARWAVHPGRRQSGRGFAPRRRIVAHRHAQVQAVPGGLAHTPGTQAHGRRHTRRRGPGRGSAAAAVQTKSGQCSGRVCSKASSFMQASNTRITWGTWSSGS
jgi:hypothetical protein